MPAESFISSGSVFTLWSVILGLAAFAFWIDTTKLGRNISGVAIIMIVSMGLSNLNIIPKSAPAYDLIWSYIVPLAIPLLLFKADLRRLIPETKGMFIAFMLGTIGTVMGAILGYHLLPLGEEAHKLAGVFSATYIGGSMNMVAVSRALELDSSLMSASVAADNLVGIIYMVLLAMMPAALFLKQWLPSPIIKAATPQLEGSVNSRAGKINLNLLHISVALTLGLVICAVAYDLAAAFGISSYSILFITALTVGLANVFPKHLARLEGDYEIGMLLMYLFFAVIGAGADIGKMLDSSIVIALFAVIIVTCHMVVILTCSRFFKLDLAEVVVASTACVLGPPVAAALAGGKHWQELVVPAVMLGVFGYVIANFIGVTLALMLL